jgi:3-phosphoshikimate 1-carboxyvinyltransferase
MVHASADAAIVHPRRQVRGRIRVPGDKSISHRYAILAALAEGTSTIRGYSPGADCAATLACLRALGVTLRRTGDFDLEIDGRGLRGLSAPQTPLDAANSGTTMRLMTGVLAAHRMRATITGDASLARRPMRRVIEPLQRMGARIDSHDGRPPLTIFGGHLYGTTHEPEVPSAQVKSALLLAGLQAEGRTNVLEPASTRDHTERALGAFGAGLHIEGRRITIDGGQRLRGRTVVVPGDLSSATFWTVLAAGIPGAEILIEGVGLNPTRTAVLDVLCRTGAEIHAQVQSEAAGEPVGWIRVAHRDTRSFDIAPHEVPDLIDEIPALAALAALMPPGRELVVEGAGELRVKESDRISALTQGLRRLGAAVEEYPDGFRLQSRPLTGTTLDAAGDHRLAMAFAIAATGASSPTIITGASSVDVSYPGFFEALERLTRSDGR